MAQLIQDTEYTRRNTGYIVMIINVKIQVQNHKPLKNSVTQETVE